MTKENIALFAKASQLSFENAEKWIEDAKTLIEKSSFGHAGALLRLAGEEFSKAALCWFISERIIPLKSKFTMGIFRKHTIKNEFILGLLFGIISENKIRKEKITIKKIIKKMRQVTDEEIGEFLRWFKQVTRGMEKKRQRYIYVDLDLKSKKVMSPNKLTKEEIQSIRDIAEILPHLVMYTREYLKKIPEPDKEKLRQFFTSLPEEAWEKEEISIDYLNTNEKLIREYLKLIFKIRM